MCRLQISAVERVLDDGPDDARTVTTAKCQDGVPDWISTRMWLYKDDEVLEELPTKKEFSTVDLKRKIEVADCDSSYDYYAETYFEIYWGGEYEPPMWTGTVGNIAGFMLCHDPVLFVHGFNSSPAAWDDAKEYFEDDGYIPLEMEAMSYDYQQSNKDTVATYTNIVGALKARTYSKKVDIVTHSMGGLNSRYYLKFLGGTADVEAWVSLAGPNHGLREYRSGFCRLFFRTVACKEMREGSKFLTRLNALSETPGDTRYGTWAAPDTKDDECDGIVGPESVALDGALNKLTACMGHSALRKNEAVYEEYQRFIDD